jgi:hypothetical protein
MFVLWIIAGLFLGAYLDYKWPHVFQGGFAAVEGWFKPKGPVQ